MQRHFGACAQFAVYGYAAIVQVDQVSGERQAKAGAAIATVEAAVDLVETLEYLGDICLFHADTGIADFNDIVGDDAAAHFRVHGNSDAAALGRELDRIGEDVENNLREAQA